MGRPRVSGGTRFLACAPLGVVLALVLAACMDGESAVESRPSAPASGTQTLPTEFTRGENGARLPCTIVGTPEADVLVGTSAGDVVCGLGGDDVLTGGAGDDVLDGGMGRDAVSYATSPRGVHVRLRSEARGEGHDVLNGFEHVIGSTRADVLDARDDRPFQLLDGGGGTNLCLSDPGDSRDRCAHPLVRSHRRAVPILVYHVIGTPAPGTPNTGLWIAPDTLKQQMGFLDHSGYTVVSLQAVFDYWHGGPLPRKPVVLSFDDGFETDYSRALPILAAHGWAGTLNLALNHYKRAAWGLNRSQIAALIRAGWELDCHSKTHASLPGLGSQELRQELVASRRLLRKTFHVPVNFFAYPSGDYDSRVVSAVRNAAYLGAVTTDPQFARPDEPYVLGRIEVVRGDTLQDLAAKLAGG
jgi:peptidoglycan/xylan/chitin deacetylase (PgdA/CDA1 family)